METNKISAPIKERVRMFLQFKGISVKDFLEATGVTSSNFKAKGSEFGGEAIAEILSKYDEISPRWLLLGEGDMIQSKGPTIEIGNIKGNNNVYGHSNTLSTASIANEGEKDRTIQVMAEQIRILEQQVTHLKELISKRDEQMDRALSAILSRENA